jgi:mRNA-degrading endonuclease RelE of RelBE toxin-antitoxin system
MKIIQSRSFERKVKRFKKTEKTILDNQIREIAANPTVAKEKKGDLRGVYVRKFKIQTTQYLLAYRFVGDDLELIMIGPRENYHRDLKAHLKGK